VEHLLRNDACSLSHWERGGVRGYNLSTGQNPHPALRADLSPMGRGEVQVDSTKIEKALTLRQYRKVKAARGHTGGFALEVC